MLWGPVMILSMPIHANTLNGVYIQPTTHFIPSICNVSLTNMSVKFIIEHNLFIISDIIVLRLSETNVGPRWLYGQTSPQLNLFLLVCSYHSAGHCVALGERCVTHTMCKI